jgi:hypothetical protein
MDHVAKKNDIDFGDMRDMIVWAFQHSPTALMLGLEGDLVVADSSEEMSPKQRLDRLMLTLTCAVTVDAAFKNKNRLLRDGKEMDYFKSVV